MKKILQLLGLHTEPCIPQSNHIARTTEQPINMDEFHAWCKEFRVSSLVNKNYEFTVIMGNHEKLVRLTY